MNPLLNAFFGGTTGFSNPGRQTPYPTQNTAQNAKYGANATMFDAVKQLQQNPAEMLKRAGLNVPEELMGNPQAMAMHLLQTGQVKMPMMQRLQPMMNMLMGNR